MEGRLWTGYRGKAEELEDDAGTKQKTKTGGRDMGVNDVDVGEAGWDGEMDAEGKPGTRFKGSCQ